MEWDPISQQYCESDDDLDQMDVASANDVMEVGGPTFSGVRKKKIKKSQPQEGTPLVPKGGQYGRKGGNFYSTLYKTGTPESGYYGGSNIAKKGTSINSRIRKSNTQVGSDARGRDPKMRGPNFG
jgi:hypothetical protein